MRLPCWARGDNVLDHFKCYCIPYLSIQSRFTMLRVFTRGDNQLLLNLSLNLTLSSTVHRFPSTPPVSLCSTFGQASAAHRFPSTPPNLLHRLFGQASTVYHLLFFDLPTLAPIAIGGELYACWSIITHLFHKLP